MFDSACAFAQVPIEASDRIRTAYQMDVTTPSFSETIRYRRTDESQDP